MGKFNSSILTILFFFSSTLFAFSQELSFIIETSEYKEGKPQSRETNMVYFGMKDHLVVIQPLDEKEGEMRILVNKKEKTMVFLNGDDRTGMKMKMQRPTSAEYDFEDYETDFEGAPSFRKTGKTMTIQNYTCHEFIASKEGEQVELWLTTELPVAYYQLFDFYGSNSGPMTKQKDNKSSAHFLPFEFRKYGFPLKSITKDNKGNVTELEFKTITKSVDIKKLSTEGYNIQDMSTMPFMNNYMNR